MVKSAAGSTPLFLPESCPNNRGRRRRTGPGGICNVTALLLARLGTVALASMRIAVTPDGIKYSWTTSQIMVSSEPVSCQQDWIFVRDHIRDAMEAT
jgi:hypothetical protein